MIHQRPSPKRVATGFTLIELLTVVAIIALLIGILLPALKSAKDQAKGVTTKGLLKAIGDGLELFKNDNEREFRSSNGYPPSAGYRVGAFSKSPEVPFKLREDPFTDPTPAEDMFGAHWLPVFLMGYDRDGFIPFKNVPTDIKKEPQKWYLKRPDPGTIDEPLPRRDLYLDPNTVTLVATKDLTSVSPVPARIDVSNNLLGVGGAPDAGKAPVIVDAFNRPVLYYAANPFVARKRGRMATDFEEPASSAEEGIFNFLDNQGFTGYAGTGDGTANPGCRFSTNQGHEIEKFGDPDDPEAEHDTFVHYIMNHALGSRETNNESYVPFNRDSYLLITAGKDGRYGTPDDVANFEPRHIDPD